MELRFENMNFEENSGDYLDAYRDAWQCAHGSLAGFSDVYLSYAMYRSSKEPACVQQAFYKNIPVGILSLDPKIKNGTGYIVLCYVNSCYRRRGIGSQLLSRAEKYFTHRGCRYMCLSVADSNLSALSFYEKNGFYRSRVESGAVGSLFVLQRNIGECFDK